MQKPSGSGDLPCDASTIANLRENLQVEYQLNLELALDCYCRMHLEYPNAGIRELNRVPPHHLSPQF